MARMCLALPTDLFQQEYAAVPYQRAMRQVELAREVGHEVSAVEWIRWNLKLPEEETKDGIPVRRLFLKPPASGALSRARAFSEITRRVADQIVAMRPDAVVCHDPELFPAAERAAKRAGARLFYDDHGHFPEIARERSWIEGWFYTRILRRASRIADHVYVVADADRARFQNWGARVTTTRSTKPLALTAPRIPETEMRKRLGLSDEDVVIAFTGSVAEERSLSIVMRLLPRLPHAKLLALGGPLESAQSLQSEAKSQGLADRAMFLGPVSVQEVFDHLQVASIGLVLLPEQERYRFVAPNKLFDYMAAGLAMVVSDRPELRKIAIDTGMAVPVADRDEATLLSALSPLVADRERRITMGRRGRAAFEREYSWDRQRERLRESHRFWQGAA